MLGGMAYEADFKTRERLGVLYAAMSDGELLRIAEKPEDLTETAREALRTELKGRNLQEMAKEGATVSGPRWAADAFAGSGSTLTPGPISPSILGSEPDFASDAEIETELQRGEVSLRTFHDSFELAKACESLETAEVRFRVQDVSEASDRANGYASVALNLIVAKQDREHAMAVLRKDMGLFPLQEVAEPDAMVDDGTVSQVGYFGRRDDADEIAQVLEEAGLWHRVTANPEGSAENEDAWMVEVREIDLLRAGEVVEKAWG